jgi:hypothetical protein
MRDCRHPMTCDVEQLIDLIRRVYGDALVFIFSDES